MQERNDSTPETQDLASLTREAIMSEAFNRVMDGLEYVRIAFVDFEAARRIAQVVADERLAFTAPVRLSAGFLTVTIDPAVYTSADGMFTAFVENTEMAGRLCDELVRRGWATEGLRAPIVEYRQSRWFTVHTSRGDAHCGVSVTVRDDGDVPAEFNRRFNEWWVQQTVGDA